VREERSMANRRGLSSTMISLLDNNCVEREDDCSSNKLKSCCRINEDVGKNSSRN